METPVERLRPRLVFAHAPGAASHQRSRTHLRPHLSLLPQPARSRASSASFPPRPGGVGPGGVGPWDPPRWDPPTRDPPPAQGERATRSLPSGKRRVPACGPCARDPCTTRVCTAPRPRTRIFFFFLINTVGPLHILSLVSHPQINQAQM